MGVGLAGLMAGLLLIRRMDEGSGGPGGMGLFVVLLVLGIIAFLVLRGRQDRAEQLGAPIRAMGSGSLQGHVFPCPYSRCPTCGASGEKMKQAWDGLRSVTWTCGYCGGVAGVQELQDAELPPGARARLGLDTPPPQGLPGMGPLGPVQPGGGLDGVITGMMIGSMLGGERRYPRDEGGWPDGGGPTGSGNDWGENDPGGGDGGGDWGDSGGSGDSGDSGGSDF